MEHGGGLDAAITTFGGKREDWLDLSTGINPFAYPHTDISRSAMQRLPDIQAMDQLLAAAKASYGVPKHMGIAAFNGTQAIIQLLPQLLNAKKIAISTWTYNEYANVFSAAGATVLPSVGPSISDEADACVVVNPNNPTGELTNKETLKNISARMSARDGWVVVDEAFADCFPEKSIISALPDCCLVLRSFGKFFGLPGLRLGFLIGDPKLVATAVRLAGPWAVSGPAIEIGARALLDRSWIDEMRLRLRRCLNLTRNALNKNNLEIAGDTPLFILAKCPDGASLHRTLAERQILVRKFDDHPGMLRFGICPDEHAVECLESALRAASIKADA